MRRGILTMVIFVAAAALAAPDGRSDRIRQLASRMTSEGAGIDDCFRLALLANEDLGQAAERLRQSAARLRAGKGLLLPSVSVQGTAFQQDPVALGSSGSSGSVFSTTDARQEVRLHLDQAITKFGTEGAGIRELKERTRSDASGYQDQARRLYGLVAQAYAAAILAEREVKVREETVKAGEERLSEMEARRDVGLARAAEVLAIRAQLSSDRAADEEAKGSLALAREDLEVVSGLPLEVPLEEIDDAETERQWPIEKARDLDGTELEEVIDARPDVASARLSLQAAQAHCKLVRGGILPTLSFSGNYYGYRQGFSQFQQETDWDATVTLAIPVFDGGVTVARMAEARSQERAAALGLEGTRRQARRDVRASQLSVRSGEARLANLKDALAQAEESAALSAEEYRQGLSTNLEVESARIALREARLAEEKQRLALVVGRIDLLLALDQIPIPEGDAPR